MDNKLFELCKDVYERTGWDGNELRHKLGDDIYDRELFDSDVNDDHPRDSYLPLYTSDYLLEKLRRSISFHFQPRMEEWWVNDSKTHGHREADTPLEALLKLTIALHDAGELK